MEERKEYKIEVKVVVSATFKQDATSAEDAIDIVKREIESGEFDMALLTDYDFKNAQVMYVGE